jgi:HK97 family phage prohead protease
VSEILHRSANVADVNTKQRLVDVLAVPWGQPAEVFWRQDWWTETFLRGAFKGVQERAGRIRVNREHRKGQTVGKIVELDPDRDDGLFARVKIVNSAAGDEVLALAEEQMTSMSVGYRTNKPSDVRVNRVAKTREVLDAFLDHLSFVEDPAFDGAQVLAVREGHDGLVVAEGPLPPTPALDAFLSDDVIGWATTYLANKE